MSVARMPPLITRLLAAALIVWLLVVIIMSGPFLRPGVAEDQITARLTRAIDELEELKRQNGELRAVVQAMNGGKPVSASNSAPPKDYEIYRRALENDIKEIWYFARAQLEKQIKSDGPIEKEQLKAIRDGLYDRKTSALANFAEMQKRDGYDSWRTEESKALQQIVWDRIRTLQNPKDCESAKKMICDLNKGCGYGCQVHHATHCLITSIALKRTLILKSKGWKYNPSGFETIFQPVSNSCSIVTGSAQKYPGDETTLNLELPIIDSISPKPAHFPLAVPKSLVPRLSQLHGNPALWWISQIVGFLLRPQAGMQSFLDDVIKQYGIKQPYVGIHIRRTDKVGTEAAFHGIEEYMSWAVEYFDQYEVQHGPLDKRRVYIATDDTKVLKEARDQYPAYEFFGNQKISASAALKNRYTPESLRGVISDIHMLAQSDHIVCTLSSQVCRVALELMQLRFPDASQRCQSLDDIFYFGGQKDHNEVAIRDNNEPSNEGEITFRKGDILGIAGNHWDGYSKGINRKTKQRGLYPSYKAQEWIDAVEFGEFMA